MEILYLLIPISILFAAVIVAGAIWAVKNDQFDNMDDAAERILNEPEPEPDTSSVSSKPQAPR